MWVCVCVEMGRNTWFPLQRNLNKEVERLSGHSDFMLVPVFTKQHTVILLQGKVLSCQATACLPFYKQAAKQQTLCPLSLFFYINGTINYSLMEFK